MVSRRSPTLLAGALLALTTLPLSACSSSGRDDLGTFPQTNDLTLTQTQRAVLDVGRTEFVHPGKGTKYSAGVEEDWCADFVSWVYRAAGAPLANPNSRGGWRIPGVATLTDYFVTQKRWHATTSGYVPKPGDAVVYREGSFVGQHVDLVVRNDAGRLTTVGGNEDGAVKVQRIDATNAAIAGFGALPG